MESTVGKPERAYAVRGNIFSFLLPWEEIMKALCEKIEEGDLSQWPLNRDAAANLVTVRLVHGPAQILDKFQQLHVRADVLRKLAHMYIDRHIADLGQRPGVLKIHGSMRQGTVKASLVEHVNRRVALYYPPEEYDTDKGKVPPEIIEKATAQETAATQHTRESAFDFKQSTMHDVPQGEAKLFDNVRPSIVVDEGSSANTLHPEVVAEHALKSISNLTIRMSTKFENQFVSKYTPRIFPWALNYDCGGAEYPRLFTDWSEVLRGEHDCVASSIQERWRKVNDEAPLLPGDYAAMLATRAETQLAGDWMVVPAARNLHWRYAVLHSAFLVCKQKVSPGESLNQNLEDLVEATKRIWQRMAANSVLIGGHKKNINGNIAILFAADDITSAEKVVLRAYLNTTSSIAGCQQIRKKIGACCFGFRVVHGECIFVTVSPSRRHSSMVLKLSRARQNDIGLTGDDAVSAARRQFASSTQPQIFTDHDLSHDADGAKVSLEVPMPPLLIRQAWNAQDPLASVYHYLVFMYVVAVVLAPTSPAPRNSRKFKVDLRITATVVMSGRLGAHGAAEIAL